MTRSRFFPLLLLSALVLAATATAAPGAEKTPSWGWKAEEGLGSPRTPRPIRPQNLPRPVPAQNAWQAKVAPDNNLPPGNNAGTPPGQAPAAEPPASVKSYCENITDPALDARFLHQKAELTRLEEELSKKTALLEAKKTEFQEWLKRRDDFINKAEANLVKLYSKIKPDAAAPQLAAMDEEAAAALLLKLSAKTSSAILNEMEAKKAARLVSVLIGAVRPSDKAPEKDVPRNASAEQPSGGPQEAGKPQDDGKS